MATKTKIPDVRDLIQSEIVTRERNLNWLATKTGIAYSTLYFAIYRKERSLSKANRSLINKALNTKF